MKIDGVEVIVGDRLLFTPQFSGASWATLERRKKYGGRKGRSAARRLKKYGMQGHGIYVVSYSSWKTTE